MRVVGRMKWMLSGLVAAGLLAFATPALAAVSVGWTSPPDGTTSPVGTMVMPTGVVQREEQTTRALVESRRFVELSRRIVEARRGNAAVASTYAPFEASASTSAMTPASKANTTHGPKRSRRWI